MLQELEPVDTNELPSEPNESVKKEKIFIKPIVVDDEDVMLSMARQLTHEQMVVFGQVIDYAKRLLLSRNNCQIDLDPPKVKVTGKL